MKNKSCYLILMFILILLFIPVVSAESWQYFGNDWNNWSAGEAPFQDATHNTTTAYKAIYAGDGNPSTNWLNGAGGGWIKYSNMAGIYYSKIRIAAGVGDDLTVTCNGVGLTHLTSSFQNVSISGNSPITCIVSEPCWGRISEIQYIQGSSPPTSFSFTAIPATGNRTLVVKFTPTISNISDINRIVWDFDSTVGSNTTYDGNYFFEIYPTGGFFTARADLYTLSGPIISASQKIDVYDYALGITPTPTVTPMPTLHPPAIVTPLTVNAYDTTNLSLINGVQIGIIDLNDEASGWFNITANNGTYTFGGYGTGGTKTFVDGHSYGIAGLKTGYQYTYTSITYQLSTYLYSTTGIDMQPLSTLPAANAFNLYVNLYDSATGYLIPTPVSGSVSIYNQSSTWTSSYSPTIGSALFYGLTPTNTYKYIVNVNGYEILTDYFASSSAMAGENQIVYAYLTKKVIPGVTPTVIPTTPQYNSITLSASPSGINLGETTTLSVSCGIAAQCVKPNLNIITYSITNSEGTSTIGVYKYNATGDNYDFRPTSSSAWQIGFTNPLTLTNKPPVNGVNTYYTGLYTPTSSTIGSATTSVNVGGGQSTGNLVMNLYAYDKATTSQLSNYNLNITNTLTGEFEELGAIIYNSNKALPRGMQYTLKCNKSDYIDAEQSFTVPTDMNINQGSVGALVGCGMFPVGSGAGGAGNTSVAIHISDPETYYPINSVLITITASGLSISPKYTGDNGESALFIIPYNTAYSIKATKDGYCSVSESKNTGTLNYQYVPLYMKSGSCALVTPTPTSSVTPTPYGWTPTPTITAIGGWGANVTGAPATCGILAPGASYVDIIINTLACNGFTTKESQNLGLSALIIILLTIILGKVGKGIGILAGAILGVLISTLMGMLPIWIIIVLVIIAGLIFAINLFRKGDS